MTLAIGVFMVVASAGLLILARMSQSTSAENQLSMIIYPISILALFAFGMALIVNSMF